MEERKKGNQTYFVGTSEEMVKLADGGFVGALYARQNGTEREVHYNHEDHVGKGRIEKLKQVAQEVGVTIKPASS